VLGRRVRRLLDAGDHVLARQLQYWPAGSRLELDLQFYRIARELAPERYWKLCKLRLPYYVKLLLSNEFPRTMVTSRLGGRSLAYGPFRTRASAEGFETSALELFQVRRCQEDLVPSEDHPGCIYGEMNQCLRPCQLVVCAPEYMTEVDRFAEFLQTGGRSLRESVEHLRDRLSEEMEFEQAGRQHERLEKIADIFRKKDELATELNTLAGAVVAKSREAGAVELFFFLQGVWCGPVRFAVRDESPRPVSMDKRLREVVEALAPAEAPLAERAEHLALLAKWFYSSWREGEWIAFERDGPPYRRLVNAVHRVVG
jgi:excinuclease ABC subunit C